MPFAAATVVLERQIGPGQYIPENLNNPKMQKIIEKINLKADPTIDNKVGAANIEITTASKGTVSISIKYCKEYPLNPLGEEEIKEKFVKMAERFMSKTKTGKCIDLVYELEHESDICDFMKHFVFCRLRKK